MPAWLAGLLCPSSAHLGSGQGLGPGKKKMQEDPLGIRKQLRGGKATPFITYRQRGGERKAQEGPLTSQPP